MRLRPGMYVRAKFVSPDEHERSSFRVRPCLIQARGSWSTSRKADGVFEAQGDSGRSPTEDLYPVLAGLKAGEQVVTQRQLPDRFTNPADWRHDGPVRRIEGI